MKKKLLIIFIAVPLLLGAMVLAKPPVKEPVSPEPTSPASGAFSDISSYPWKSSIEYLQTNQAVQGYSDGTFKPDKLINRAEFTKIVIASRFAGELNATYNTNCFPDVPRDQWFTQYICLAKTKGIVGGYPDGTFQPSQSIRQAEALKILLLSFNQLIEPAQGEWYQQYLNTAQNLGMLFFAPNNTAGYQITRGEMSYFTAWHMSHELGQTVDQITPFADPGPFTYSVNGTTRVVAMDADRVKMAILSGNNSLRPKNLGKCSISADCVAESQAEPFNDFVWRSHKELLVNGAFFDAYSLPLDGVNFHQIASDIITAGEIQSMYGFGGAFGNGGMLAQFHDGRYQLYFPIRDWTGDFPQMNFAIANYPLVLDQGHVRTREEIGTYAENDEKFWLTARRGGLGISADGNTIYYVSAVGTVEDLGSRMLEQGVWSGFSLDSGASNAFSFNGATLFAPGRNLTTVVEFYESA